MKIKIEVQDAELQRALQALIDTGRDLTPVMADIGEAMLNSTRQRFSDQVSPQGEDWSPLSHVTKARKKKNKDKILTEEGRLRRLLSVQAGEDYVEVGSTRIYAGTHQFGARRGDYGKTKKGASIPWGDIPARPFLGFSDGDKKTALEIIQKHLKKSIQ